MAELDFDNIPNFQYVDEQFKDPAYDPGSKFSVPYTWGVVGLFYNTEYVDEVTSWRCCGTTSTLGRSSCSTTPGTPSASPSSCWDRT